MSPETKKIYDAIRDVALTGNQSITANVFTHCFSRSHVSAAFRAAKRDGIVEVGGMSIINTPIYKPGPTITSLLDEQALATIN